MARKAKVTNFKAYKRMRNLKKMKKYSPWVLSMVLFFAIIGVCYVFRDRIIAPATTFYSNFIKENYQQVVVGMSNTAP